MSLPKPPNPSRAVFARQPGNQILIIVVLIVSFIYFMLYHYSSICSCYVLVGLLLILFIIQVLLQYILGYRPTIVWLEVMMKVLIVSNLLLAYNTKTNASICHLCTTSAWKLCHMSQVWFASKFWWPAGHSIFQDFIYSFGSCQLTSIVHAFWLLSIHSIWKYAVKKTSILSIGHIAQADFRLLYEYIYHI